MSKVVSIVYSILLAISGVFFLFYNKSKLQVILLCFVTLVLTYLALNKTKIKIPSLIYVLAVIFIFMSQYLGNALELYFMINHWDKILHFISGFILGLLGYAIFLNLVPKTSRDKMSQWLGIVFTFVFGSACAGIWEIYEFAVDNLLGFMCQNNLTDTMMDIIAGTVTALIVAFVIWVHKNKKKLKLISDMEDEIG